MDNLVSFMPIPKIQSSKKEKKRSKKEDEENLENKENRFSSKFKINNFIKSTSSGIHQKNSILLLKLIWKKKR